MHTNPGNENLLILEATSGILNELSAFFLFGDKINSILTRIIYWNVESRMGSSIYMYTLNESKIFNTYFMIMASYVVTLFNDIKLCSEIFRIYPAGDDRSHFRRSGEIPLFKTMLNTVPGRTGNSNLTEIVYVK